MSLPSSKLIANKVGREKVTNFNQKSNENSGKHTSNENLAIREKKVTKIQLKNSKPKAKKW